MAIQRTKQPSDLEKRLQLLRRQVYGKGPEGLRKLREPESQHIRGSDRLEFRSSDITGTPSHSVPTESGYSFSGNGSFRTDISFLHQDLLKILILASFAIGAQIVLFILSKNHILNLNFF